MHPIAGGVCSICGEGLVSAYAACASDGGRLCGLCQRMQPSFVKAAGYRSYRGGLRELIHLLKYEHVKPTANVLGRMLAETIRDLKASFGSTEMLVLPVPLHGRQLRLEAGLRIKPLEN
jgi:predicted amidophosphoribosyltransferase